jgi:hypothetical protein
MRNILVVLEWDLEYMLVGPQRSLFLPKQSRLRAPARLEHPSQAQDSRKSDLRLGSSKIPRFKSGSHLKWSNGPLEMGLSPNSHFFAKSQYSTEILTFPFGFVMV